MLKKLMILIVAVLFFQSAFSQSEEIIWAKRTIDDLGIPWHVMNAIFSPDDSRILLTTTEAFVELDPENGEVIREIADIHGAKCFSEDGKFFYTYDLKKINYATMEVVGQFEWVEPGWEISGFTINEKAGILIGWVGHAIQIPVPFRSIFIYDLNTYQLIKETGIKDTYMGNIAISSDGQYFVTYSYYKTGDVYHGTHKLWSTTTLDTIKTLYGVRANMKFSPDSKLLGSVSGNLVRVHDTETWEMKYDFMHNPNYGLLTALDFTSDTKYLATGGNGSSVITNIHIWNLDNGELENHFNNLFNYVIPDRLYYNSYDSNIIISNIGQVALLQPPATGVIENDFVDDSIMHPNPSSGKIEFDINSFSIGQLSILLSDINGIPLEILYDGIYTGEGLIFDVSHLPTGTYFITATQDNFIETYKLIKE